VRRLPSPEWLLLVLATPLLCATLVIATTSDGAGAGVPATDAGAGRLPSPVRVFAGTARIVRPATESGEGRRRIRVVVPVRLRNSSLDELSPEAAFELRFDGGTERPDVRASGEPGAFELRRPVPRGAVRSGELRFELGGLDTLALQRTRRPRLRISLPGLLPFSRVLRLARAG